MPSYLPALRSSVFAFGSPQNNVIPQDVLTNARQRNVAYYAHERDGPEKPLQFEELSFKAKDGEVFQLKEPEQEREIIGPILELSGTKVFVVGEKRLLS